eukprot:TRINITY_DN8483_c0_g1_i1.p1 TRINITY_DN8483_c0_g1~~TRINITY_DN8483_c0_g1_i1.p1  ORF type:complete len:302 (-),score=62.62 TRINITY_DN8483_c0_g1_i1:236-1141(-)
MSLDIKLKKSDKTYRQGDLVSGTVCVTSKGSLSHNGITLLMEGNVTLQMSGKNVGVFDAFYNSLKPIQLVNVSLEIAKPGKLPDGETELPFEIPLEPLAGLNLFETYHGVFINISYLLRCDMPRPLLAKNLQKQIEFIVEVKTTDPKLVEKKDTKVPFTITPETLDNVKKNSLSKIPRFKISGYVTTAVCEISKPFVGELIVEEADAIIKSIEVQLVRVETCGCAEGYSKDATEIQNIQIGEGNVCRSFPLQLYMIFPRLFTCPTIAAKTFKIEFEVNLVILLSDGYLITENFPIKLIRTI